MKNLNNLHLSQLCKQFNIPKNNEIVRFLDDQLGDYFKDLEESVELSYKLANCQEELAHLKKIGGR